MDQRPKRRKHRDNPYVLEYNEKEEKYIIHFKNGEGILQSVEIDYQLFSTFDKFELEDLSELNEFDNHIEHSEIYEESIHIRTADKPMNLEEEIEIKIDNEQLHKAISKLPEVQKRRIIKYYFEEKTLQVIAAEEKCSSRAIKYSIDLGIEKIKEFFKK